MAATPSIQSFIKDFYAASDVGPSGHTAYVSYYQPDCRLAMGPIDYEGHAGIQKFRETGWEKVATRKHTVLGTFTNPERPEEEVMLYGTVDYGFKDGTKKEGVEWAGRMELAKDSEGVLKLRYYEVYIVSYHS